MIERRRAQAGSDGVCWSCRVCHTTKSIRQGSFFSKSKLTLQKWFIAMVWWSWEYPVTEMAQEAEVVENTACDIYQWLREVCSTKLLQNPIVLGGPGVIVQIDESQFKHKSKVQYTCMRDITFDFLNWQSVRLFIGLGYTTARSLQCTIHTN